MRLDAGEETGQVAAQLARDRRLFDAVEAERLDESFRLWESSRVAVVVGRFGDVRREVRVDCCRRDGVPIVRRISGGGAVVVGPGCLNYSFVLSQIARPALRDVTNSYKIILGEIASALDVVDLTVSGVSDLAVGGRKVSGSAQRRGRRALLHHGTLLSEFDSALMERYLRHPPRQPAYRRGRRHVDFVGALPLSTDAIRSRLGRAFASTIVLSLGRRSLGEGG